MSTTLTFEKEGRPLALIQGGKQDKKIVSLSTTEGENPRSKIELSGQSHFQAVPDTTTERTCIYVFGPSGSGKTTYTSNYLKQYKKQYKKNPIYLFSAVGEDSLLDDLGGKRIRIDDEEFWWVPVWHIIKYLSFDCETHWDVVSLHNCTLFLSLHCSAHCYVHSWRVAN